MNRFNRQIILPEIGIEGQERLKQARVLCVGLGGLGSPISIYLAAAGVGTLGLIDPDSVELSNLQRQVLFRTQDQKKQKVDLAKERLLELNPDISIHVYQESLNISNIERILTTYDLIIDGTDNFTSKFLINDAAIKYEIPMIYGAVNQFEGQVSLFFGKQGPCYRCLHPKHPTALVKTCAETGVLGAVVGVVGTLQATLALEYLISGGNPLHPLYPQMGMLTVINLKQSWNMLSVQIPKNPKCRICSIEREKIELVPHLIESCAPIKTITPKELQILLKNSASETLLIDVREKEEWDNGHLQGAYHHPLSWIEKGNFPHLAQSTKKIIIYCKSGIRSTKAVHYLLSQNIAQSIYSLEGGFNKAQDFFCAPIQS